MYDVALITRSGEELARLTAELARAARKRGLEMKYMKWSNRENGTKHVLSINLKEQTTTTLEEDAEFAYLKVKFCENLVNKQEIMAMNKSTKNRVLISKIMSKTAHYKTIVRPMFKSNLNERRVLRKG